MTTYNPYLVRSNDQVRDETEEIQHKSQSDPFVIIGDWEDYENGEGELAARGGKRLSFDEYLTLYSGATTVTVKKRRTRGPRIKH